MTFQIDTGTDFDPLIDACPDWLRDMLPDNAPRDDLIRAQVEQLVGELHQPAKAETVHKRIAAKRAFVFALIDHDPDAFHWIMTEYTEAVSARR